MKNGDTIHKRAPRNRGINGPRSICGRYGYTTHFWRNVTCDVCRARKPKSK